MSIIVDHVSYVYSEKTAYESWALKDVSFKVDDGEFIGVIGQTGSGKSTLMQHLNGLLKANHGTIYYDGQDIYDSDFSLKELRSRVGLVFQYPEHQLFEENVFKDVCFGPLNLGLSKKDAELMAYNALKLVNVKDEYFYASPFDLSGGEKRRVAIAGVLAMNPRVLILDEPTAGLDPKGREEILDLILKLKHENNMTVILVSHSMDDVAEYVDRLIVMNNGMIVMDAGVHEVFSHYDELTEIGLSVPQVTSLLIKLQRNGIPVRTSAVTVNEALSEIMGRLC